MSIHTTSKPIHQKIAARRLRIAAAVGVPAALTAGLLVGTPSSAEASQSRQLAPWYTATFPTWSFGALTTFCVQSDSANPGNVRVNVLTGAGENVRTAPFGTTCIKRSWWGAPLLTQNVGAGYVTVRTH